MRPHGSHPCFLYGQAGSNPGNGCRCPLCVAASDRHRYRTTPRPAVTSPLKPLVGKSHLLTRIIADRHELAWRSQAACAAPGVPTGIFYPSTDRVEHTPDIVQAIAICDTCPVVDQCLGYALQHDEPGIWGGTTPRDRLHLRRQQQAG